MHRQFSWFGLSAAIAGLAVLGLAAYTVDRVTKDTGNLLYGLLAGAGVLGIAFALLRLLS